MAMIRTKKQENPFVQLDKHFIEDESLTFKAKGILSYILSKPDGWQVRMKDLINHTADGKAAVSSGLEELMLKGYIYKFQERSNDGTFGDWVYEVYERPEFNPKKLQGENIIKMRRKQREERKKNKEKKTENRKTGYGDSPKTDFPISENPASENPKSENQSYSNNESSNNDFNNNESSNNHHHEAFNKRQNELFNRFVIENKIKIDDDTYTKLLNKLIEYKPNSIKYIAKVYESIINNDDSYTINHKVNDHGHELFKQWEEDRKKAEEEQNKKTPEELDRERKELERLLKKSSQK